MCGFIVVRRGQRYNNAYISRRGPDLTVRHEAGGYVFLHNLLSITGRMTPQPFVDGGIVCVYNGEIYNHPYQKSDGEVLIPLYRTHGAEFPRFLDGEFAIALYDFERDIALFATDPFATKPLYRRGDEVASYASGLGGGHRIPANTAVLVDLLSGETHEQTVAPFDFSRQHKDSFEDWILAFERSITKRATPDCYLPLSAGYDSGAIDCALRRLGSSYKAFSIVGQENRSLLQERNTLGDVLQMETEDIAAEGIRLRAIAEPSTYRLTSVHGRVREIDMLEDLATHGLSLIHALARAEGRRVCLSGQGADEIICDYSHWPWASELGGHFPDSLHPWSNFDGNYQTAYLTKEEVVAGAHGIETRYPFLDRELVQEFLWLSPELKNCHYKAPLREYLMRFDYPFEEGVKVGFAVS